MTNTRDTMPERLYMSKDNALKSNYIGTDSPNAYLNATRQRYIKEDGDLVTRMREALVYSRRFLNKEDHDTEIDAILTQLGGK